MLLSYVGSTAKVGQELLNSVLEHFLLRYFFNTSALASR